MNKKTIIETIKGKLGFEELNPIQLSVLSSESKRMILLAPTGSGKTVAFAIAMLKVLESPSGKLQAVVVAPSRELAIQTGEVLRRCATGYKVSVFYGGHRMQDETASVEGGMPDIIVATPGRLTDHLKRRNITLADLRAFIVDEFDKLLELGFEDEMKKIARQLPRKISLTMLTSATVIEPLPEYIPLADAVTIDYRERTADPRQRMQVVEIESPQKDKLPILRDLLLTLEPAEKSIVFVNHRESAERVYNDLKKHKFPVVLYHGGLEQQQRELAVDLFNNGSADILVATDLAARGLDIAGVSAIIHYHLPLTGDVYTHRNGRTARVDASGVIYIIRSEEEGLPEFINVDRLLYPNPTTDRPASAAMATIYLNAGKQQKISRGDIVGFLINNAGLSSGEIGKITIKERSAMVAVARNKVRDVIRDISGKKIKNKTVRFSIIEG